MEHAFPVVDDFSISMSQPRRATMDLSSPPPGGTLTPSQARTGKKIVQVFGAQSNRPIPSSSELTVTINPGQGSPFHSIALQTNDIPGLRKVLVECRRLKEVLGACLLLPFRRPTPDRLQRRRRTMTTTSSRSPGSGPTSRITRCHRCVRRPAFFIKRAREFTDALSVSPIPPDLRKIRKLAHARLSAASAGLPGNDIADIEAVREDWMRTKVEEDVLARCEKAELRCLLTCP